VSGASILGTRVLRIEDPKFLTVGGNYCADLQDDRLAGAGHVAFARSQMAHATIDSIDTSEAAAMPGVIGVYSAADLGLTEVPAAFNPMTARGWLAIGKVRYVGEPVVAVVAETAEQAADAAAMVEINCTALTAYSDVESALAGTELLYPGAGSNAVFATTALGMPGLTGDEFFADCEVVVSQRIVNNRVAPCPLEVRSSAAAWIDGRLTMWVSNQNAQGVHEILKGAHGLDGAQVHVITPDVGGGFGAKIGAYPEDIVLGFLAKATARPVRWFETRSESMLALGHGRSQVQYATIGGTRDGKVQKYGLRVLADSGAAVEIGTILAPFMTKPMAAGVYHFDGLECETVSIVTNTTPIVAYRGAGRPEATAAVERMMDIFAAEIGMDPADVRRKNLIAPFMEPHITAAGQAYDCGDYEKALDKALEAADYTGLRAEQARRRAAGDVKQLGIGVSTYVEITGGVDPKQEAAKVEVLEDGSARVYTGTSPHGQGHMTAWAMLAHEQTGIPMDRIELVWGDTDLVPVGGGTMGSRSLQQGGVAVHEAAILMVDKARELAARLLEADVADVVLDKAAGSFHVAGTPAVSRSWGELATAAQPDGGLIVDHMFVAPSATFPFGSHVAVVEVDTETGETRLIRHVACDDAGRVLNPMLLEGQIHGGIAQGAAQALLEEVRYDAESNPVTGNLADYAMISAAELPSFEVVHCETPTPVNPLGAKGIGESGTIGSTPAVQSAVVDALAHLGVRHIDIPCTPQRVWQTIVAAAN
jgi:aerobic carbon-monoxide dehydrogenase large subunit